MEKRFPFLIGLIIILVLIGSQSIFIVNQTEKALVIQLGDPVDKVFGPGLPSRFRFGYRKKILLM